MRGVGQAGAATGGGAASQGLAPLGAPLGDGTPREVFLFVIAGHKALNPLAAVELIRRVG